MSGVLLVFLSDSVVIFTIVGMTNANLFFFLVVASVKIPTIKGVYTKEEGMQLTERAKC